MPKTAKPQAKPKRFRKFTVYYLPEEEAGGYTVHIPALGIVTEGQTLKEAKEMAKDAVLGWLEAAQELGKPIPDDVTTDQVEVSA